MISKTNMLFILVILGTSLQSSLIDGISGVVTIVNSRNDLAERIKTIQDGRLLMIAFTGKTDHLNKSDITFFMAIHQALYDKTLQTDFLVYSGPISDAMANQYSLHSFALPKVVVSQGPGKHRTYDGGRKPVHITRWLQRLKRTETDL